MTDSLVAAELDGSVARVRMDDGKLNVLSVPFLSDLDAALDAAERHDDAGSLLLTGRPNSFSAGLDLKVVRGGGSGWQDLAAAFVSTMRRMFLFPKPIVAVSEGHAIAGGMIIFATADVRLALNEPDARYGLNETRIGVPLTGAPAAIARHAVPPQHQAELILHAHLLPAATALQRGLVHEVLDTSEALAARSLEIAEDLAGLDRAAYEATKLFMREPLVRLTE